MFRRLTSLIHLFKQIVSHIFHGLLNIIFPPRPKSIYEDIILITGGGRGIGRVIAIEMAKHRPKHIILWGRTESTLADAAKDIQKLNVNCDFMVCDVSSKEQVYAMAKEVEAKFGPVTMLINNAGIVTPGSILDASIEDITQTLKSNTLSNFWSIRAFLPGMLDQGHGHLVSINSMLGKTALNGAVDYCASKFATCGLHESLRDELDVLKLHNIHVTSVHPYQVDNSMFAGVTVRFPRLFPPINEQSLGAQIVHGVLCNRVTIIVPFMMHAVNFVYSIAPVKVVTTIMKFLHVHKSIDQYHEHRNKTSLHR